MSTLESVSVETDDSSLTEKKVTKRRSSVFKRQSILQQDLENTNITEDVNMSKIFKSDNTIEVESFDVEKYIQSLKDENKKWRKEYSVRKSQVHELSKCIKKQTGQALDIACLSDSERSFLAARPNYEEFNKNLFQLKKLALKVSFLNAVAENCNEKINSKIEIDIKDSVHRIIKLVD